MALEMQASKLLEADWTAGDFPTEPLVPAACQAALGSLRHRANRMVADSAADVLEGAECRADPASCQGDSPASASPIRQQAQCRKSGQTWPEFPDAPDQVRGVRAHRTPVARE